MVRAFDGSIEQINCITQHVTFTQQPEGGRERAIRVKSQNDIRRYRATIRCRIEDIVRFSLKISILCKRDVLCYTVYLFNGSVKGSNHELTRISPPLLLRFNRLRKASDCKIMNVV